MLKGSILFNALLGFWGFGSVTILVTFLKKTLKNLRKHSTIHCSVLKDRGQRILRIQGGGVAQDHQFQLCKYSTHVPGPAKSER